MIKTPHVSVVVNDRPPRTQVADIHPLDRLPGYGCIFPTAVFNWDTAKADVTIHEWDCDDYPEESARLFEEMSIIFQEMFDDGHIMSGALNMERIKHTIPYLTIKEIWPKSHILQHHPIHRDRK